MKIDTKLTQDLFGYIMMIVWFITKWINYSIQKNQLGIL
jgi:hypothetical protein